MDELIKHLLNKFSNDEGKLKKIFILIISLSGIFFLFSLILLYLNFSVQDYASALVGQSVFIGGIAFILGLLLLAGDKKAEEFEEGSIGNIVVVPINILDDISWIEKNLLYYCQKNRFFRDNAVYMAFYHLGRCKGYWSIKRKINIDTYLKINDDNLLESVKDYWSMEGDVGEILKEHDVYVLEKISEVAILIKTWNRPVVRKQQYISTEDFNNLPEGLFE